jgi:hypothetical protein
VSTEPNWKWWASSDEERYQGPYDTREEAIATGARDELGYVEDEDTEDGKPVQIFYIVEAHQAPIQLADYIDVGEMVERWEDNEFYELCDGENDKGLTEHVTTAEWDDLQARLRAAAREWQAANNVIIKSWNFTEQRKSERVEVPVSNGSAQATSTNE